MSKDCPEIGEIWIHANLEQPVIITDIKDVGGKNFVCFRVSGWRNKNAFQKTVEYKMKTLLFLRRYLTENEYIIKDIIK